MNSSNQYKQYSKVNESSAYLIPRKPLPITCLTEVQQILQASPYRQKQRLFSSRFPKVSENAWFFEILSLVLSICMFGAVVLTLAIHRDKALPNWPRFISVNSLVAIFTSIMKASLILPVAEGLGQLKWHWFRKTRPLVDLDRLDLATRGPWGSLLILFTRSRSFLIYLGAMITVIALAIDPFSQQVLRYQDCSEVLKDATATLYTATNYSRSGVYLEASDVTLDPQMLVALYRGLIDPQNSKNSSVATMFKCPIGNCTFPAVDGITHQSLAMCSVCTDRTSDIIQNVTGTTTPLSRFPISHILPATFDKEWAYKNATLYASQLSNTTVRNELIDTWLSIVPYRSRLPSWYVAAFDALMYRDCSCGLRSGGCECDLLGASCALYPCVKSYWARVQNLVLEEREVSRIPLLNGTLISASGYGLALNTTIRNGQPLNCTVRKFRDDNHSVPIFTGYHLDSVTNTTIDDYSFYTEGCTYAFDWLSTRAMRTELSNTFWYQVLNFTTINYPYATYGSAWLTNLFQNGSATLETVQRYVDDLADAVTTVIRQHGSSPESTRVKGFAYAQRTCVKVQWAWLGLPAALLVLTTLFLTMTIWTTGSNGEVVWKSSPLALLFHGFDHKSIEECGALDKSEEMRDAARTIDSRLEKQERRWSLMVESERVKESHHACSGT